jgi:hypothetical protein
MAFLQLKAVNANEVMTNLKNVVMRDYTPLWPYAAEPLRRQVRSQFATEGADGAAGPWAQLEPNYARRKARKYGAKGILVAGGDMYDAFQADEAFTYGPRRMTYGPKGKAGEIAYYHQTGYKTRASQSMKAKLARALQRKRGEKTVLERVPARRVFDWPAGFARVLSRALARGYVVITRRKGYAIWQQENQMMGGDLLPIGAAEARMMGQSFYSGS